MIDNDRSQLRPPNFDIDPPAVTSPDIRESIFASLGLIANPFTSDPGAGPFIDATGQSRVLDALATWWSNSDAASLAIVTGPVGSGKTRVLLEFRNVVARDTSATIAVLIDRGARRSDANLLREIVTAFGGAPAGRTGLELQGEVRQQVAESVQTANRPLILIDAANFAGSQLEILRTLLTESSARIVLFGEPDLADRVARRHSLAGFLGPAATIDPFQPNEIADLIRQRLILNHAPPTSLVQIDDEVLAMLGEVVLGNPGSAVQLMHSALIDAVARGRTSIDRDAILQVRSDLNERATPSRSGADLVVQTRFALPGFEDVAPSAPERSRRRPSRRGGA